MTDNELLLAISEIVEKKIKAETEPIKIDMKAIKDDIETIKHEQKRINLIIENKIQPDINLLAENYMPAAKKYTKEVAKIEAIQADIDVMKNVIREHSEKLQEIS